MTSRTPHRNRIIHRRQLLAALSRPELRNVAANGQANRASCEAAYQLALALGRCRIFGANPGEDIDGTMPAHLAVAAARELLVLLEAWKEEVETLEQSWLTCKDSFQTENLCMESLGDRMDAWAAYITIDEAYSAWSEAREPVPEHFSELIDTLTDSLEAFDDALAKQEDLLSCVTETHLLENWRDELAPPYLEALPWWLDGRLEEAARRCQEEAMASMPGASLWCKLRTAHQGRLVFRLPELLDAAAAGEVDTLPALVLRWTSPDGSWQAELMLPRQSTVEEESRRRPLNFFTTDFSPAPLAGQPASLGGVVREIDASGRAWFTLAELRQASELTLIAGTTAKPWVPVEELDFSAATLVQWIAGVERARCKVGLRAQETLVERVVFYSTVRGPCEDTEPELAAEVSAA